MATSMVRCAECGFLGNNLGFTEVQLKQRRHIDQTQIVPMCLLGKTDFEAEWYEEAARPPQDQLPYSLAIGKDRKCDGFTQYVPTLDPAEHVPLHLKQQERSEQRTMHRWTLIISVGVTGLLASGATLLAVWLRALLN